MNFDAIFEYSGTYLLPSATYMPKSPYKPGAEHYLNLTVTHMETAIICLLFVVTLVLIFVP